MNARALLGDYLRELRKSKDYSLRELGKIISVSAGYISDLENGRLRIPRWKSVQNIALATGGNIDKTRALYAIAKTASYLDGVDLSDQGQVFMEAFITLASTVFKDFAVTTKKEVIDTSGHRWDIAFDFKKKSIK